MADRDSTADDFKTRRDWMDRADVQQSPEGELADMVIKEAPEVVPSVQTMKHR